MGKVRIFAVGKNIEIPNVDSVTISSGDISLNVSAKRRDLKNLAKTYGYIKRRGPG